MKAILRAIALSLFGTMISFGVFAQTQPPSGQTPPVNPAIGAWEAPIGHRQPTESELPPDVRQSEDSISELAKGLDKKLTICRGC
jgi:hypothetical protein